MTITNEILLYITNDTTLFTYMMKNGTYVLYTSDPLPESPKPETATIAISGNANYIGVLLNNIFYVYKSEEEVENTYIQTAMSSISWSQLFYTSQFVTYNTSNMFNYYLLTAPYLYIKSDKLQDLSTITLSAFGNNGGNPVACEKPLTFKASVINSTESKAYNVSTATMLDYLSNANDIDLDEIFVGADLSYNVFSPETDAYVPVLQMPFDQIPTEFNTTTNIAWVGTAMMNSTMKNNFTLYTVFTNSSYSY